MSDYPEILTDLAEDLAQRLAPHVDQQAARKLAFEHVEHIRRHWGGQPIYIPRGLAYDLSERDLKMIAEFNGHNHDHIARKYKLTTVRVYQILKVAHAEYVKKHQNDIFGETE